MADFLSDEPLSANVENKRNAPSKGLSVVQEIVAKLNPKYVLDQNYRNSVDTGVQVRNGAVLTPGQTIENARKSVEAGTPGNPGDPNAPTD